MRELELAVRVRPGRLEVRLVGRAPLPRGVLAHLGLGDLPALRRGAHRAHPRRLGDLQHHAAGESSGAHRRARRHARPPQRGPLRVRHRPRLVQHRVQGLRHPRRRHDAGDVRRVAARDPAHVARDQRTATRASTSPCPSATCCRSRTASRIRRCGWRAAARRRSRRPAASASARCASASARRSDFEPLIKVYKDNIKHAEPVGEYVNDNVACVTALVCLEDRQAARARWRWRWAAATTPAWCSGTSTPSRAPPACRRGRQLIPEPTPEQLDERIASGQRIVGDPDECAAGGAEVRRRRLRSDHLRHPRLDASRRRSRCRSVELFGKHVQPRFDKDPVHSTTRMREAALAQEGRPRGPRPSAERLARCAFSAETRRAMPPRSAVPIVPSPGSSSAACSCRSRRRARRFAAAVGGERRHRARCGASPRRATATASSISPCPITSRVPRSHAGGDVDRSGTTPSRRSASWPPRRNACACCRTCGWRRIAIRWSPRRRSPRSTRCPAAASSSASAPAICEAEFAALGVDFARRGALLDEAIDLRRRGLHATSIRSTTARRGRCATSASDRGRCSSRVRRSGSAARRRRHCAAPPSAATAGCRRACRRWACRPPSPSSASTAQAHARRRADRDRHECAVALRRHAALRASARTTAPARAAELAEIFRGIKQLGVQHCGVRFRSRSLRRADRPDRGLRRGGRAVDQSVRIFTAEDAEDAEDRGGWRPASRPPRPPRPPR